MRMGPRGTPRSEKKWSDAEKVNIFACLVASIACSFACILKFLVRLLCRPVSQPLRRNRSKLLVRDPSFPTPPGVERSEKQVPCT